jgi:hypothetical protein
LYTFTRTNFDASLEVKTNVARVALAISAQVELSEELCHWYVKVPDVDQVPFEALNEVPTVQDPVTAGATEFVMFKAGTTAVPVVVATIVYATEAADVFDPRT